MLRTGRKQFVKWTTEGAVKSLGRVFCDVEHTLVAGNMMVFLKVRENSKYIYILLNQGGTADRDSKNI